MGLLITFILGGFIALGAFISYLTRENNTIVQWSISIALGTLATLALIELIPETIEHLGEGSYFTMIISIVIGFLFLTILDQFLPDHHESNDGHHHTHGHEHGTNNAAHIGVISAIAVTLHNIIEGMAVYSVTAESLSTGLMVAIGVGLHNIPMGMVIYTTLKTRPHQRKWMLVLSTVSTFIGGIIMALLWGFITDYMVGVLIAITLGMIFYIVFMELIPMVLSEKKWNITIPGILIGVIVIVVSTLFE